MKIPFSRIGSMARGFGQRARTLYRQAKAAREGMAAQMPIDYGPGYVNFGGPPPAQGRIPPKVKQILKQLPWTKIAGLGAAGAGVVYGANRLDAHGNAHVDGVRLRGYAMAARRGGDENIQHGVRGELGLSIRDKAHAGMSYMGAHLHDRKLAKARGGVYFRSKPVGGELWIHGASASNANLKPWKPNARVRRLMNHD